MIKKNEQSNGEEKIQKKKTRSSAALSAYIINTAVTVAVSVFVLFNWHKEPPETASTSSENSSRISPPFMKTLIKRNHKLKHLPHPPPPTPSTYPPIPSPLPLPPWPSVQRFSACQPFSGGARQVAHACAL